jgi:ribosomal protein S18 acetylase RimI-like enzyme
MTAFTNRLYAGATDLQGMIDLIIAVRPADRITDYPGAVDLQEAVARPFIQANTRLWEDAGGRLVSFAFVDEYRNLRFEIAPRAAGSDVESQIITWGEECLRKIRSKPDKEVTLDASCREDDAERVEILQRQGFKLQSIRSLHMVRALDEPILSPHLPAGFIIRQVVGENEVEAIVALHRAAFGTDAMTIDERLAMMRTTEYDPELDLVAIAPDGTFAAYCMCSISQEENSRTGRNEGYTDPVATHPEFQRQGLARALLLTGLRLLKQRGMETAVLGTSSENDAMRKTAESVGFSVQSAKIWFAKKVA